MSAPATYLWCGRCGQAIEPDVRDNQWPYCRACRVLPVEERGCTLAAAMKSLRLEELRGVPE